MISHRPSLHPTDPNAVGLASDDSATSGDVLLPTADSPVMLDSASSVSGSSGPVPSALIVGAGLAVGQAAPAGPSLYDFTNNPGSRATITITNQADLILNPPSGITVNIAVDGYKAPYSGTVHYVATSEAIAAPYNVAQPLPYFDAGLLFDPVPHWTTNLGVQATAPTLTFSFMQHLPSYASPSDARGFAPVGPDLPSSVLGMTPQQILAQNSSHAISLNGIELAAITALANWATVANVHFVAASDSDAVAIRFGSNQQAPNSAAYSYLPGVGFNQYPYSGSSQESADIYVNRSGGGLGYSTGAFGGLALAHEIGHALGLGGESGNGDSHDTLPGGEDTISNTVMTYNQGSSPYPAGPQPFDIAAVQYLYGPNPDYHPNASHVWSFSAAGGTGNLISDGGGTVNTISAAATTQNAFIDLRPGHWNYLGMPSTDILAGNQLMIDYGTLVQDAIGGAGNDTLVGNDAGDSLLGGAGNDLLVVGSGNSTLDGGSGNNIALFADARANYTISTVGGVTTVTETLANRQGSNVLTNIQTLQFSDQAVTVTATPVTLATASDGTLPSFDHASSVALDLTNLKAGQSLLDLTGNDTITSALAGVTITASAGNDGFTIPAGATGSTSFTGLAGNDTIIATGGSNLLVDGTGNDLVTLSGGSSTLFTGSGSVGVAMSGGTSTILASQGTTTIAQSGGALLLGVTGGSGQISLTGGSASVISIGGTTTLTGAAATPFAGFFGGTDQISLGSGGGTLLNIGATITVQGGSGLMAIDLIGGQSQLIGGAGMTELFVNGGHSSLTLVSNGGGAIISGFNPALLTLAIPRQINGQSFTNAGQIPVSHDAAGNIILDLGATSAGEQLVMLIGVSSIGASAITLV